MRHEPGNTSMAISWITVLKTVPWSEVISNAPKVADGARKLWNAVARKPSPQEDSNADAASPTLTDSQRIAALEARVAGLKTEVSNLHAQMAASSELIKELADQNAHLIQRIDRYRVRVLWLAAATGGIAVASLVALFEAFARHG